MLIIKKLHIRGLVVPVDNRFVCLFVCLFVVIFLPEVLGKSLSGHSYDDMNRGTLCALLVEDGTHTLVRVMMPPQHQVHLVFLQNQIKMGGKQEGREGEGEGREEGKRFSKRCMKTRSRYMYNGHCTHHFSQYLILTSAILSPFHQ